jgi:replicative DNA helicase
MITDRERHDDTLAAERAVLGCVLLYPAALPEILGRVEAGDFAHPAHGAIFQAVCDTDAAALPVDVITVTDRMRADDTLGKLRGVNGEAYFAVLVDAVVTPENVAFHAELVRGRAIVRRIVEVATGIAVRGRGDFGDLDEFLGEADSAIRAVVDRNIVEHPRTMKQVLHETNKRLEERHERGNVVTGVPSGMRDFDLASGGYQPGELIVVAARPAMGKTAWMGFSAVAAAEAGCAVMVVSLEMDRLALGERHLASAGRIEATKLRSAKLLPPDWLRAIRSTSHLSDLPIWIDDETDQTIEQIRGKVRRWRMRDAPADKFPKAVAFVDYLQKIRGSGKAEKRSIEVGSFSGGLKNLARQLRMPVVALAQLNRACEARADKRPMPSDLRESGDVEQDADCIGFLYRHAVYEEKADAEAAEFIIGKGRNMAMGTIPLRWQGEFTRYSDEVRP